MRRGLGPVFAAAALTLASLPASGDEIQRMEAVGAVALIPGAPAAQPPRDAALRKALSDAVRRVALDQLPELDPLESEALIAEALGDDPLEYATRFRILEDRGERPALFVEDPEVETEYVVVVEVHVDVDRVRERLAASGVLIVPSGEGLRVRVRVVVVGLESHAALAELRRTLLEGVGVRSALPEEVERGRAVIAVDGNLEPIELLEELLRAAPPELQVTPIEVRRDSLTLGIRRVSAPPGPRDGPEVGAFDTTNPNRY